MRTLTLEAKSVKPSRLEIRNATYEVTPIDPGFHRAAVQVRKMTSGDDYAVVLQADGLTTCECADYTMRQAARNGACKHIRAVQTAGLLPRASAPAGFRELEPAVAPVKPTVAPMPRVEPRRPAVEFTTVVNLAPAIPPAPAPVAEAAPAIPAEEEGPAWTWDAWTDADVWELGPEPELASDDESAMAVWGDDDAPIEAVPPMAWVAITDKCVVLTNRTPVRIDYTARNARLDAIQAGAAATCSAVRRDLERRRFEPTVEEEAEAAALFRDDRHSCPFGESGPPIGDRSWPRHVAPPARPRNTISDLDVHPYGVC